MREFKNIIFDFGGVIIQIDYNRMAKAFKMTGLNDFDLLYTKLKQNTLFDDFEKGVITPGQFRNNLRELSGLDLTDEQIDDAWNAILITLPKENINFLEKLKKSYRLFLLSNTNAIHEKAFMEIIMHDYGRNVLADVFERIYFSHNLHMRKPDKEIFIRVMKESNLNPEETLFVDDSPQHIEGAKKTGLSAILLEDGKTINDYFHA